MSTAPHLVIVAGFLGAGKTTLILAAAQLLAERGLRSAIILNDQSDSLVDTELARANGFAADEVTGGCFCCRFSDLIRSAERLLLHSPDVVFAEPVGSCTDLSATILHPIRNMFPDRFRLAPLTVLVDPARAEDLNRNPDIAFLFRKQLEEADVVCFTKSDRHSEPLPAGIPNGRRVSAFTGQGVAAWLDEVLSGAIGFSGATLDIDYARYAEAEASLAWLNADVELTFDPPLSPAMALGPFLDRLDAALTREGIRIAHLKALDRTPTGYVKAALCANGEEPVAEGALDASPATRHHLLLNLRASASPEPVRTIVEDALSQIPARPANLRINSFRPAAPKPEFRLAGPFAAGSFF